MSIKKGLVFERKIICEKWSQIGLTSAQIWELFAKKSAEMLYLLPLLLTLSNCRACFFAMTSPTLLFVFYAWTIPESPMWLLQMGYENEADAILIEIAETNKTRINHTLIGCDPTSR